MDGCLCLWLFVQGELYPTELTTLPFQGDNRLQDNNLGAMALTGNNESLNDAIIAATNGNDM